MELERNYRALAYTITIPREEIMRYFKEALKEADETRTVDDIVADKLSKRIVTLINSDLR